MKKPHFFPALAALLLACALVAAAQSQTGAAHPVVLHAARLLDVESGRIVKPGEVLVQVNVSSKWGQRWPTRWARKSSIWATPLCCPG
jgi:hypothetical protein